MLVLVAFAVGGALPIFSHEGFQFIIGTDWNAVYGRESFGAFPYIMAPAQFCHCNVPISLGIAIFVTEIAPHRINAPYPIVELLAAVPSIIYGLWALFVFRFWIRDLIERPLYSI